jgi:TPR repeat protein
MRKPLLISALAGLLSLPILADFAAGLDAYQKGDYAAAQREWLPLAEQGSAAAQYNLALMYYDGKGVPQDYTQAANWFLRAAEQDYIEAQHNLGAMYGVGKGVKRDYVQAYKWLNICASKGNQGCAAQRDLVSKKLNASKLAEAQRLSSDWKPRASDK